MAFDLPMQSVTSFINARAKEFAQLLNFFNQMNYAVLLLYQCTLYQIMWSASIHNTLNSTNHPKLPD